MYDSFVRNRITELRMKKGVTEYRMSRDLCHSKSYIQSISSGKALPSLSEFFRMRSSRQDMQISSSLIKDFPQIRHFSQ